MAPSEGIEPPVQEPESYVLSITPRGPLNIKNYAHKASKIKAYQRKSLDRSQQGTLTTINLLYKCITDISTTVLLLSNFFKIIGHYQTMYFT